MIKHRRKMSDAREYCEDIHEDDGCDPRRYFQAIVSDERKRKTVQLCGQVGRALNLAFLGLDSQIVSCLFVVKVVPAPTLMRLESIIDTTQVPPTVTSLDIHAELARVHRGLRLAVGAEISRKYVPELVFRFAAPHEVSS